LNGVLAGVRVVELGTYVAAPALGNMLGILGATVTKVEPPEGDPTRKGTPWSWVNYNWNKKSASLDLKSGGGLLRLKKLIAESDVFIESLSPRAIKELGIGFSKARRINPCIVYCSIKGFAHDSSSAQRLGFDTIAQAEGGLMHVVRGEDGRPSRVGNPCVDLTAATFGMVGVLAALMQRPRRATYVEVPLYDVVVYWNGYWFPFIDIYGKEPSHLGSSHPGFSPYGVFSVKDGYVFIGALSDSHWAKLVERLKLGGPGLYAATSERVRARVEVNSMVQSAVSGYSADGLLALLGEVVPCARVSTLTEIHDNRELEKIGTLRTVNYEGRQLRVALPPFLHQFVKGKAMLPPLERLKSKRGRKRQRGSAKDYRG
jgi:crotonobetainyl-CoA:carnitine CoA-transferase CaiB-like acyl-CoA transferase